jgi:AcrR family transcriptional regulator
MPRGIVDKEIQEKIIIEAATDLFLKSGFAGTTMEQVAEAAGVVKQTVYNHFPSKEWLFRAMVENVSGELRAMLPLDPSPTADFRKCLLTFSKRFLRLMLQPTPLGLYRILISEAPRFPELAKIVFMTGANQTNRRLAGYLRDHAKANELDISDFQLAAEQFMGLLRGNIQLRALLMVDPQPTEAQLDRAANAAVNHFLRAYRIPSSP